MNQETKNENGKELIVREEGGFSLQPRDFGEAIEFAKLMAKSELVPKDYRGKPENVLVAVQMGQDVGLKAMAAIQNIAVINGRPCLWGDAALAVVKNHRDFISITEDDEQAIGKSGKATCIVKRRRQPDVVCTFSTDDAKKAGLLGKQGPWTNYPNRMLKMRARGFAIRDSFPDALKGLSFAEEVQDYIDIEPENVRTVPPEEASGSTEVETPKDNENTSVRSITDPEQTAFKKECFAQNVPAEDAKKMLIDNGIPSIDKIPADRFDEMFKGLGFLGNELKEKK